MNSTGVEQAKAPARISAPLALWPHFGAEEIEASTQVLRSGKVNYWTGQQGRLFESEFAASVDVKHAICVANGTLALELALSALGIGQGDEVITTSRTFIASASCAVMRGARPICVDVDRDSQNITADTIRKAITSRTKAIIAVHLGGWPCEMDEILTVASEHNLKVIEDCAQAQGALYKGRPVGSLGHAAAFSFCQDKIMTTAGEGGMLVTNDSEVWERAWSFKDHGKNYRSVSREQPAPGFRWLHDSFGTNWRMTEVQSAVGRVLLKKVPDWVRIRRANAGILQSAFAELSALRVTSPPDHVYHAYYKYYVFLRPEKLRAGWDRNRILLAIAEKGVPCFSGSCSEIYLESAFPPEWRPEQRHKVAAELGETSLMFQVHPTLSEADIYDIAAVVSDVVRKATVNHSHS